MCVERKEKKKAPAPYHSIFQIQASLQDMVSLSQELNYLSLDFLVMGTCCIHLTFLCAFQISLEKELKSYKKHNESRHLEIRKKRQ